jgi:ABC-type lipoprotein release transport system permease subunit
MLLNYWKIVFRNLWKYKNYTLINLVGMGIGIAAMVWGYQTYRYSFSFDNFHKDRDHVYRVLDTRKDMEGLKGNIPMAVARLAPNDFSGIKTAVRYTGLGMNVRQDTSETFGEYVHFIDPAFFELFNFPLVSGNNNISDPNNVLLTQQTAKKYFGNRDPVGKTLTLYAGMKAAKLVTVAGIVKDPPLNSMFHFNMLTNFDNLLNDAGQKIQPDDWTVFIQAIFFKVPDAGTAARLSNDMAKYLPIQNRAREDVKLSGFRLATLRQVSSWTEGVIGANALYPRPGDAPTYGPLVLAFLIFLSACLNFSNTTVSHAGRRLKEIGMRKVMGSSYTQLIVQLLAECSLIVLAAILLSILLNSWWIPFFNTMFRGVDVHADYFHDPNLVTYIGCMLILATLMAGTYPAFYMSRFNATAIFRGAVRFSGANIFSRVMLGLQLSIAIITMIAGIAFADNSAFQKNYDYGYNIENSMWVQFPDSTAYFALKNQVASLPGVTSVAGTRHHFGFAYRQLSAQSEGVKHEVNFFEVGRDYPKAMGLKMAAGRNFEASMESDYTGSVLITEKMAAMYGWRNEAALGKRIRMDSIDYSVVGVLKDFHSETLFEPTMPMALKLAPESRYFFLVIQANPRDLPTVFQKVRDTWKRLYPTMPFNAQYQNQVKAEAYSVTNSIATIFQWFALISILLTATGLFALVSMTTLKKMKEIAMRKVVGAGPRHILVLINRRFFWIFIIASFFGCFAGLALTRLLLDLIFKINVGVTASSLVWSVIGLFVIAGLTSGIKVWQAVRTNPVKLLRSE